MPSPRPPGVVRTVLSTSAALLLVLLNLAMCQSGGGGGLYLDLGVRRIMNDSESDVQECLRYPEQNPACMCGERLNSTQEAMIRMLNSECSSELNSSEATTLASELDFCGPALYKLGYRVTVENITSGAEFSPSATFSSTETLNSTIQSLKGHLRMFEAVLDRTIVGVYLRSLEQRCACLEAYKQWLCVTKLPLHLVNSTSSNNCTNSTQLKPCISVCHKVLQRCPYYLPSKFQLENGPQGPRNVSRVREVIYGGYPAFDCPRCEMHMESCSYARPGCTCIGDGASQTGSKSNLMALLVLLTIFSTGAVS